MNFKKHYLTPKYGRDKNGNFGRMFSKRDDADAIKRLFALNKSSTLLLRHLHNNLVSTKGVLEVAHDALCPLDETLMFPASDWDLAFNQALDDMEQRSLKSFMEHEGGQSNCLVVEITNDGRFCIRGVLQTTMEKDATDYEIALNPEVCSVPSDEKI